MKEINIQKVSAEYARKPYSENSINELSKIANELLKQERHSEYLLVELVKVHLWTSVGLHSKAIYTLINAKEFAETRNLIPQLAQIYGYMGNLAISLDYPQKAIEYFSEAKNLFDKIGNKIGSSLTGVSIAEACFLMNKHSEAAEQTNASIKQFKELNADPEWILASYCDLAKIEFSNENSSKFKEILESVRHYDKLTKASRWKASAKIYYALNHMLDNQLDDAYKEVEKAKSLAGEFGHPNTAIDALIAESKIKQNDNKVDKAILALKEALSMAKEIKNPKKAIEIANQISEIYQELNKYKEAIEFKDEILIIQNRFYSRREIALSAELNANAKNQKLKQEREEANKQKAFLQQKNKELEHFAQAIAHDLKAPLRSINAFSSLIKKKELDESAKEYLDFIIAGTKRMDSLIAALLKYSKTAGQKVYLEDVSLDLIAKEVTEDLSGLIRETNTNIDLKKLPKMRGHKILLKQLLQNIISNAIKFTPKDRNPEIEINTLIKEKKPVIYIKDNGIGIDDKEVDSVFEVFKRSSNVSDVDGTGIGLSICQKIMEKHNGKIWLESKIDEGTTFFLKFPNSLS